MNTALKSAFVAPLFALAMIADIGFATALPIKPTPGQNWCQCSCRTSTNVRDLSWAKTGSCNSNGKACNLVDGGKSTPGTLGSCTECSADTFGGATNNAWKCVSVIRSFSPAGTLQRNP